MNYYAKFDKEKLIDGSIPKLLNKYKGKENELVAALEKKYGKLPNESGNPVDDASAVSMDSTIKSEYQEIFARDEDDNDDGDDEEEEEEAQSVVSDPKGKNGKSGAVMQNLPKLDINKVKAGKNGKPHTAPVAPENGFFQKLIAKWTKPREISVVDYPIGDLKIILMTKYHVDDPAFAKVQSPLYLAVPMTCTALELKKRIHGATKIPVVRMRLMFCGEVLSDDDMYIPDEAFELAHVQNEDDEVFRPHIYLSLMHYDAPDAESVSSVSTSESVRAERAAAAALAEAERQEQEELERERAARAKRLEDIEFAKLAIKNIEFNLKDDLHKIGCDYFYDTLRIHGYADEGAFSNLTDDVLRNKPLYIPKRARYVIAALADAIKRRIDLDNAPKTSKMSTVENDLLEAGKIHKRQVEGLSGEATTKKDIQRAWEAKVKKEKADAKAAEEEKLKPKKEDRPKRVHAKEVQDLMDRIRRFHSKDEFGLPATYNLIPESKFCCEKHKRESIMLREKFVQRRKDSNSTDMKQNAIKQDTCKYGFLSREALRFIAINQFKKFGYNPPLFRIDKALDHSIRDSAELLKECEWLRPKERDNILFPFPVVRYDTHKFIQFIVDIIEELDREKYLWIGTIKRTSCVSQR